VSQFEKAMLVSKLRGARDRKRATGVKVEGRKSHAVLRPDVVALARQLQRKQLSLRGIAVELFKLGHTTKHGKQFSSSAIASMLEGCRFVPFPRRACRGSPPQGLPRRSERAGSRCVWRGRACRMLR